jgi:hypothetical protein
MDINFAVKNMRVLRGQLHKFVDSIRDKISAPAYKAFTSDIISRQRKSLKPMYESLKYLLENPGTKKINIKQVQSAKTAIELKAKNEKREAASNKIINKFRNSVSGKSRVSNKAFKKKMFEIIVEATYIGKTTKEKDILPPLIRKAYYSAIKHCDTMKTYKMQGTISLIDRKTEERFFVHSSWVKSTDYFSL